MHEMSIAQAVLEQARRHRPHGAAVRSLKMRAGPMRAIVPEAMDWAWKGATLGTEFQNVELKIDLMPWTVWCADCNKTFQSDDPLAPCSCGGNATAPVGGDELTLISMQVDDPPDARSN